MLNLRLNFVKQSSAHKRAESAPVVPVPVAVGEVRERKECRSRSYGFIPPGLFAPIKACFLEFAERGRNAGVRDVCAVGVTECPKGSAFVAKTLHKGARN